MTVGTPGLREAKELAKDIYSGDDFSTHYLLGYLWASLTIEQQQDVLESLRHYRKEKESK
jgi:hypothetical protein